MELQRSVKEYAAKQALLCDSDRVLVAVSGGPDSVALLHILNDLKDELKLHLEVAHLQHGIRGDEAKRDAQFVAELAAKVDVPFHLKEVDLPQMKSAAGKGNLEALARAERYRFFAEIVGARSLDKVAIAHTRDDQAETVLMWFLRGAGMKGMGGMAPRQELRSAAGNLMHTLVVIRPLLDVSKAQILEYLAERNLAHRIDRSNQDPAFLRNWIRAELLPKIHQRIGADFSARLSHQAELLRDEDRVLEESARRRHDADRHGETLDRLAFLGEPKALRRRILRLWIARARGHLRGLDFVHIEALLRLIDEGPAQSRLSLPGGWELVREYETLRLQKRSRGLKRLCYSYGFEIGATVRIAEAGVEFTSERLLLSQARLPTNLMEAIFDASFLTAPMVVRNFRHGDRFRPLGMAGHKKIKDLFIENKVPLSVRVKLPLLTMGDEILWIPGYGRSANGQVAQKTVCVLHIKAMPIEA